MLIILKATNRCSLRCRYCSGDHGEDGQSLGPEECRALAEQLPAILKQGEEVRLLWQGGEVSLMPAETLTHLYSLLATGLAAKGHKTHSALQTNGLRLSQKFVQFMHRLGISPGVSMDGPDFLHNAMRCTPDGQPSYEQVSETLSMLCTQGLTPSLLCVVTPEHVQHVPEIVDWLEYWHLPVRFNPLLACGRSSQALSEHKYYRFLRDIFELCAQRRLAIPLQPLEWMLWGVLTGAPATECSFSGQCGTSVLSLYPGGDVGTCGRGTVRYGNILHEPLVDILQKDVWKRLRERDQTLRTFCAGCNIWQWCHGGCPDVYGVVPNGSACEPRREFFSWLATDGLHVWRAALLEEKKRLQRSLEALKAARGAEAYV